MIFGLFIDRIEPCEGTWGRDSYASRIGGIAKGLKRMRHISKLRTGAIAWLIVIASISVHFFVPLPAVADFGYEAVSGDTYWDIAVKFDISLTELLEINGLSENDLLSIGKDLIKFISINPYIVQIRHTTDLRRNSPR